MGVGARVDQVEKICGEQEGFFLSHTQGEQEGNKEDPVASSNIGCRQSK